MDISTVVNTINSVRVVAQPIIMELAPKVQETMKDFSERMLQLVDKYPSIENFAKVLDKASDIMGDVLYVLGINSDPAVITGLKMQQSEKGIEEFENVQSYIKYLNEEIKLDKEKFENLLEEEKVAYAISGLSVEIGAVSEKMGVNIPVEAIDMIAKLQNVSLDASKLVDFVSKLKDEGINDLNDVCECINGEGESNRLKTGEALINVLDELEEGEGNKVLNEIIDEIRE